MTTKVKLKKGALDHFRTLSRNSSLEVHAYLVGSIISPETVIVDSFAYPKEYHTQTKESVAWRADEYDELKRKVESNGKRIVGDIHSHPGWDAVMSPTDYKGCIIDALRICGICSVYGKKTRVRFWIPDSALPCDIVYK